MQKKSLLIILAIILLALIILGVVWIFKNKNLNESIISRGFSSSTVAPGEQIDVTLSVTIIEDTYYAIEEYIPTGWTITDDGGGGANEADKLVWVVLSKIPLKNTDITYTVQAPSTTGTYNFDGTYMFEGDTAPINTKGATTVTVQ